MKRRGRKATGRKPQPTAHDRRADSAKTGKGTRKRQAPRSRRPVDPDEDVFIPKDVSRSGVASQKKVLTSAPDPDEDVFIPKPVYKQSDWVKDVGAPDKLGNPSIWEPFQGVRPRAGSPVGWSYAELYTHGLERVETRNGDRVRCRYGCTGTTSNVVGVSHHSHNCPYWTREGATHVPF